MMSRVREYLVVDRCMPATAELPAVCTSPPQFEQEASMRRIKLVTALSLAGLGMLVAAGADADGLVGRGRFYPDSFRIQLKGFEEVIVVVTGGNGELRLTINEAAGSIAYQLGYSDLEGTVTQGHIHIGQ